jgi:hypothetical protein
MAPRRRVHAIAEFSHNPTSVLIESRMRFYVGQVGNLRPISIGLVGICMLVGRPIKIGRRMPSCPTKSS